LFSLDGDLGVEMNSITLHNIESWAGIWLGLISLGFLIFAYARNRMFALLALAVGNVLFLVYAFMDFRLAAVQAEPGAPVQMLMTGLYVFGSVITTVGMALLCVQLSRRSSSP
jgi:hypothetical protein